MSFENFPYSNFHELNLDWIVQKLKEAYSSENPPDYPVKSVNGMTGDVIIAIPSNFVQSVNGETGDVVLYRNPLTQFPATDETRWNLFRICDGTEKGIEFDADSAKRIAGTRRILIYDEDNPPDYPVTSVNGQTGDVQITAGVQSINGKTGNVVTPFVNPNTDILALDSNSPSILWGISRNVAGGNIALYITSGSGTPQAFIRYIPTDGEAINLPLLTNADIPQSAGVVSVNRKTGVVTLTGNDIETKINSGTSVYQSLYNLDEYMNVVFSSLYELGNASIFVWEIGNYLPNTGAKNPNRVYIRTTNAIPNNIDAIKSSTNLVFALHAWENDVYIGTYNKETGDFSTPTVFTGIIYNFLNIASLRQKYPTYTLKLSVRTEDSSESIQLTDAETILTYSAMVEGDITDIQETVANHTQQITALQSADTTHTQQITALQNTDTTHTQQITALQNTDTTHTQQITALQQSSNSYSQQIAELYTKVGAGIKEVKFTDVVTLPIRYPETGTDTDITENMACVNAILSRPGVQRTNLTIVFYNGYLTISGTIQGLTDIILYLTKT